MMRVFFTWFFYITKLTETFLILDFYLKIILLYTLITAGNCTLFYKGMCRKSGARKILECLKVEVYGDHHRLIRGRKVCQMN